MTEDRRQTVTSPERKLLKQLMGLSGASHRVRNKFEQANIHNGEVFTAISDIQIAQHSVDEKIHLLAQAFDDVDLMKEKQEPQDVTAR